jgi:hypothetical protein
MMGKNIVNIENLWQSLKSYSKIYKNERTCDRFFEFQEAKHRKSQPFLKT